MSYGYGYDSLVGAESLVGKFFTRVERNDNRIILENDEGQYVIQHMQDCCEHVYIESVSGDLADLENSEIRNGNEHSFRRSVGEYGSSNTITTFTFASDKGVVSIRFNGSSNGYYGEGASIYVYKKEDVDTEDETE